MTLDKEYTMFIIENLYISNFLLNIDHMLFLLVTSKQLQSQSPEWWEVISGVLAIPVALLSIILSYRSLTQKEQIDDNTELIKRLIAIEQRLIKIEQVINNSQEKKIITPAIINEHELKHLQRLASDESYLKYKRRGTFQNEIRRLRTLGFIQSIPNKYIGSMSSEGNLRDYVKITEHGRDYLDMIYNQK
jgi:hypothetical protein